MHLVRLSYVSVRQDRGPADLDSILRVSQERNARDGITGALIVTDREFAQVLEGPRPEVTQCTARILRDLRHREIQLVSVADAPGRQFPGWTMEMFVGSRMLNGLVPGPAGGPRLPLSGRPQVVIEGMLERLSHALQGRSA